MGCGGAEDAEEGAVMSDGAEMIHNRPMAYHFAERNEDGARTKRRPPPLAVSVARARRAWRTRKRLKVLRET